MSDVGPMFRVKLKGRDLVAERTMSFHFEKPAGFVFLAGQFIDMELLNPRETDAEGNSRAFSVSSAPYENTITVTTRLRDTAFKRVLETMPLEPCGKMRRRREMLIECRCGPGKRPDWRELSLLGSSLASCGRIRAVFCVSD